jgi:hypothetical protein
MTRRTDRLDRIEASLGRVEGALGRIAGALNPDTPGGLSSVAADAKGARSSSEAAFAGVQALAAVATAKPTPAELAAAIDEGTVLSRSLADGLKSELAAVNTQIRTLAAAMVAELRKEPGGGAPPAPAPVPRSPAPVTPVTPVARAVPETSRGKGAPQ